MNFEFYILNGILKQCEVHAGAGLTPLLDPLLLLGVW